MTTRILQIIPTLDRCGAEKQLCLLARDLPKNQFDVHVCALTRGGPLQDTLSSAGIPLTIIGKKWKIDPFAYRRLVKLIRELEPDIVHTWIFAANAYGRQAAIAAGVKHIVAGERCVDSWKRWHEFAIDRRLARRTDRIVTNSTGVKAFYVHHGLPADKFSVIPNGVDATSPPPLLSRAEFLREFGLPGDARVIGCVNRLWPQKRVKDLIWSSDLLKVVRDDTHLLVIGDGPQRWRLEQYTEQIECLDRVHFVGQRADVASLLPHFECLWLGSQYEGQSNAIMEAMSAGIPVVATDIPGNRDLVVHDQTGYLVPIGDRAAIASWTKVLLEDRDLATRLGQAGHQRMRDEFTVERMVQRYVDLYTQIVAS